MIDRQGDEIRRLTEASVMWQVRAIQAEERLKQLTAGDEPAQDAPTASPEAPGEAEHPRPDQEGHHAGGVAALAVVGPSATG